MTEPRHDSRVIEIFSSDDAMGEIEEEDSSEGGYFSDEAPRDWSGAGSDDSWGEAGPPHDIL